MIAIDRIELNSDVLFGKPVIKGTRISIEIILNKICAGKSWENIQNELDIQKEDISAALKYVEKVIANKEIFEVIN